MIKILFLLYLIFVNNFSYSMYIKTGKIEAKENCYFSYYLIHKNLEIKAFKNKLDNKIYLSVIDENKQDIINEYIFDDNSYIYKVIFNDDISIMGVLYGKYDEEGYNIKTINLITKNTVEHNDWCEDAYLFDKFLFLYKENELNIYEENNLLQKIENILSINKLNTDDDSMSFAILDENGLKRINFNKNNKQAINTVLKNFNVDQEFVNYFHCKNNKCLYIYQSDKTYLNLIYNDSIYTTELNIKTYFFKIINKYLICLGNKNMHYLNLENIILEKKAYIENILADKVLNIENEKNFEKLIPINNDNFCLIMSDKYLVFANIYNNIFNILQIKEFYDSINDVFYDEQSKKIFVRMKNHIDILEVEKIKIGKKRNIVNIIKNKQAIKKAKK